jgi:hypothetical protein
MLEVVLPLTAYIIKECTETNYILRELENVSYLLA